VSSNPLVIQQDLAVEVCCACQMTFAIPHSFQLELKRSHETFHCPKGHGQHYPGVSDFELLQRKLQQKEMELATEKTTSTHLREQRDQLHTKHHRLRDRVKKGHCPASRRCKVRFHDLAEHLKKSHKRYP